MLYKFVGLQCTATIQSLEEGKRYGRMASSRRYGNATEEFATKEELQQSLSHRKLIRAWFLSQQLQCDRYSACAQQ